MKVLYKILDKNPFNDKLRTNIDKPNPAILKTVYQGQVWFILG